MPYLQKNWRPRFGFLHGVSPEKCHLGQGLSFDHKFHKFSPIRITLAMRGGHLLMHRMIFRPVCSQNVKQVWRFEIMVAHVLLFARLCDKDLLLLMMIMIHDYSWWFMMIDDDWWFFMMNMMMIHDLRRRWWWWWWWWWIIVPPHPHHLTISIPVQAEIQKAMDAVEVTVPWLWWAQLG